MPDKQEKSRISFLQKIWKYFTTGILVIAPSAVTFWIFLRIFHWFDNILGKWYVRLFEELGYKHPHIPGLGAITLAIIVIFIGILARHYAGRKILNYLEKAMNSVPLINRIYLAVRQLSDSFATGSGIIFLRPVMIEYPRRGLYSIGFVTRDCEGAFCRIIGKEVSSIFIPTTPNPTSGVILFVPRDEMIPLNMTIEDAMKLIISAGKLTPDIKLPVP